MIEQRRLTKDELELLISEAPEIETRNLKKLIKNPYEFFDKYGVEHFGILNNVRPLYFGALTCIRGNYVLWTIVNNDVKEQFSLYKLAKQAIWKSVEKYGNIYATMEKINLKNIEWTKRIGFEVVKEDDNLITLKIGG